MHRQECRLSASIGTVTPLEKRQSQCALSYIAVRSLRHKRPGIPLKRKMPVKISYPIVISVIAPNIGGWAGGYITRKNIKPWYETLKRPSWNPPNWVFAPVWTTLYCTMGYSSYLVWKDGGGFREAAIPLSIYSANLLLNWSWTPLFFGLHNIKWALYEITVLWGSTVAMGIAFYSVNRLAGCLVIPYLAWNSLAMALNYVIYRDNKPSIEAVTNEKKE